MSENIVPFTGAADVPDAAAKENVFRLDVIEAARTLEKAAEVGLVADVGNLGGIQAMLLQQVVDAVDLAGLEVWKRPGRLVGIISGVDKEPKSQVRLTSGEGISMPEFILALRHEDACLCLPAPRFIALGFTATFEALRDRLGDGAPF